jgi:hypothetical protein
VLQRHGLASFGKHECLDIRHGDLQTTLHLRKHAELAIGTALKVTTPLVTLYPPFGPAGRAPLFNSQFNRKEFASCPVAKVRARDRRGGR